MFKQTESTDKTISNELRLWRYVIKRGILDACSIFEDSKPYRYNPIFLKECRNWFYTEDFEEVCSYANMSPDYIRKIYMNAKKTYQKSIVRSSLLSALLDKIIGRYND